MDSQILGKAEIQLQAPNDCNLEIDELPERGFDCQAARTKAAAASSIS
ncbi:hypothetical protein [Ruegeria atlantica]|nr:hypothetical protein [Ruegeria atlantica]